MRRTRAAAARPTACSISATTSRWQLLDFIAAIEDALGMPAERELLPMQPGDVPATFADIDALSDYVGYRPATPISEGIGNFVDWYRDYYGH
jgi:UDP-glucuronate 4-epimerase